MKSSTLASHRNRISALKISEGDRSAFSSSSVSSFSSFLFLFSPFPPLAVLLRSDTVLVEDAANEAFVEMRERKRGVDGEAAAGLWPEGDVRRLLVEPNTDRLEL